MGDVARSFAATRALQKQTGMPNGAILLTPMRYQRAAPAGRQTLYYQLKAGYASTIRRMPTQRTSPQTLPDAPVRDYSEKPLPQWPKTRPKTRDQRPGLGGYFSNSGRLPADPNKFTWFSRARIENSWVALR